MLRRRKLTNRINTAATASSTDINRTFSCSTWDQNVKKCRATHGSEKAIPALTTITTRCEPMEARWCNNEPSFAIRSFKTG